MDDGENIKVSFYEGSQRIGMVYEYKREETLWRVVNYERNGRVQIIREEILPIEEELPEILTAEHSLCSFLKSYLCEDYFRDIEPKGKFY